MRLTEEERLARDKNKILIGVAHAGVNNLTGSIVSCAVSIDYENVDPAVVDSVLNNTVTKKLLNKLQSAINVINIYELDSLRLNSISDTQIATYLADYHALYGCIFSVFHKYSTDPDYVFSESEIKEVIQNKDLSLYTNKRSKSSYVVMKDWTQFDNLLPNTRFSVRKPEEVFTLLFAKACATAKLESALEVQKKKYPGYDLGVSSLTEKQTEFLKKNGLTELHRAYLPELSQFAFNKHILI